eukprot:scaffold15430_cov101-Isochrysis_galbana.AAC.2
MEHLPADARAAPSASVPNDIVMDIHSSPKRPRDPAQGNKVSQRATPNSSAMPESQPETETTVFLSRARAPATACCLPEPSTSHHPYGSVFQVCRQLGSSL